MTNGLLSFLPKLGEIGDGGYFEVFGIKLHMDDLIIIGLLFFLYTQESEDHLLFIALVMLLIS